MSPKGKPQNPIQQLTESILEAEDVTPDPTEQEFERIESTFPSGPEIYWKVYKLKPKPGVDKALVREVMDTTSIPDFEIFIRDLARDEKWGSGEYQAIPFAKPENRKTIGPIRGPARTVSILLPEDQQPAAEKSSVHEGVRAIEQATGIVGDVMRSVRDILPQPGQGADFSKVVGDLSKSLSDTLAAGLKAAGHNSGEDSETTQQITLLLIRELLKRSENPPSNGAPADPLASLTTTMEFLSRMGLLTKPDREEKKDLATQIGELKTIASLLGLQEGGGASSPWVLLAQSLGPKLLDTMDSVADAVKAGFRARSGGQNVRSLPSPGGEPLPGAAAVPSSRPAGGEPAGSSASPQPDPNTNGGIDVAEMRQRAFWEEIKQQVRTGQDDFPVVLHDASGAMRLSEEAFLAQITARAVSRENVQAFLENRDPFFGTPPARSFLDRFFAWTAEQIAEREYFCPQCGALEHLSGQEYRRDPSCANCGTRLQRKEDAAGSPESAPAPAGQGA